MAYENISQALHNQAVPTQVRQTQVLQERVHARKVNSCAYTGLVPLSGRSRRGGSVVDRMHGDLYAQAIDVHLCTLTDRGQKVQRQGYG